MVVIEPAQAEQAGPTVLASKNGGTFQLRMRYCKPNAEIIPDSYPISRMDEYMDSIRSATIF